MISEPTSAMEVEIEEHPNDLREQIRVLTEGIRTLTSILTTPSECIDGVKRIEQLQSIWRLEDTGFSSLFNVCKQMQNTLHLTSLEADKYFDELRRVREIASTAEFEEEKMKKIVFTLEKEKIESQKKIRILINEVEDHKKDKKLVARSIRNFMSTINEKQNIVLVPSICSIPTPDVPDLQYSTSISSSEDGWGEISSASSGLVTDDGCATIRFPQREAHNSKRKSSKRIRRHGNVSEISFPSKYVGIQFSSVLTKGYFKNKEDLLVCGFMGFDDTFNRRPPFGSRLVRVDEISLEREKWKMEDLVDYICTKSGPIQMRFCNEPLTTAQIEQLVAIK